MLNQQRAPMLGVRAEPGVVREYAESTQSYVDEETARVISESYERAIGLLEKNKETLEIIAKKLLEVETLDEKAFQEMLKSARVGEKSIRQ